MSLIQPGICPVCRGPIVQPARGRRRKWCSDRCRREIYTWRKLRGPKASWLEGWRSRSGEVARRAVARLEYELAVLAELDGQEEAK